ncbi:MAG: DUF2189 domain-containing protein [Paenacidovorax caeni]
MEGRRRQLAAGRRRGGVQPLAVGAGARQVWLAGGRAVGLLVAGTRAGDGVLCAQPVPRTGGRARMAEVLRTWLFWQSHYRSRWDHDYWCLVRLGLLLALAGTGWVLTSAAMITLLAPAPVRTPYDFLLLVVLAKDNNLFELWLVLGSVLAAPIFASSVVSIALLLDRRIGLWRAVLTSWQAVLANPVTMALWSFLILALVLVGMATFMLGLALVMPWLEPMPAGMPIATWWTPAVCPSDSPARKSLAWGMNKTRRSDRDF